MKKIILLVILITTTLFAQQKEIKEAIESIKLHEGFRKYPKEDVNGYDAIGYGWNLKFGITKDEAEYLLEYRIKKIDKRLSGYKWYVDLTPGRKSGVIDMVYNLGFAGFFKFKKVIISLKRHHYKSAKWFILHSKWKQQVKIRARDIAYLIENNKQRFK